MKKLYFLIVSILIINFTYAQWTVVNSNTTSNLNSIFFCDNGDGYIVGDNGIILKTVNGVDWVHLSSSPTQDNLKKVYFLNSITGFIVGENGAIFKTNDAGNSWSNTSFGSLYAFYSIEFTNDSNGYIVGIYDEPSLYYPSVILRTTDGGNTWVDIYHGWEGVIYDITCLNDSSCFVVENWTYKGQILKTNDYALTNNLMFQSNNDAFTSIHQLTNDTIYVTGELFNTSTINTNRSIDGGNTWNACSSISGRAIFCTNNNTCYTVGKSGKIYKLINCIQELQSTSITNNLKDILFLNDSVGYIVGENGTILKTNNGGGTFIEENNSIQKFNIYPNPTTGVISITNEGLQITDLEVFDIYGKEVYVNRSLSLSKCEIDLSSQPKGIYIIKVCTSKGVAVEKVVLE